MSSRRRAAVPISTENFTRSRGGAEDEAGKELVAVPDDVAEILTGKSRAELGDAKVGLEVSIQEMPAEGPSPEALERQARMLEPQIAAAEKLQKQILAAIDDGPKLKFAEAVLGNLSDEGDGYAASHVEVGNLKPAERDILKRLRTGLSDAHVKLESGKHVESAADVVRWLLQQVATLARAST